MTSRVAHTSVDCTHAYELSQWWKSVLDYVDLADDRTAATLKPSYILSRGLYSSVRVSNGNCHSDERHRFGIRRIIADKGYLFAQNAGFDNYLVKRRDLFRAVLPYELDT